MNQARINALLNKIKSIISEDMELSSLEKDLIKGYLREAYELIDQAPVAQPYQPNRQSIPPPTPPKSQPTPFEVPPVQEKPSAPIPIIAAVIESMPVRSTIEEPLPAPPLTEEKQANPVPVIEQIIEVTKEEVVQVQEIPEVFKMAPTVPDQYHTLFQETSTNELSDRLSHSPIEDLRRAMGINDRLLIVNSLFGGDHDQFNDIVDILNSKYGFEDAKFYLIRYVIDKFGWLDEENVDGARDFIKLVKRRFL